MQGYQTRSNCTRFSRWIFFNLTLYTNNMYALSFICLFLGLFFLSRSLTSTLSFFIYRITQSHKISVQVLAFLFFPGVIIHELSHWLVASILFVPTGEIDFLPQVYGDSVKLGSVQVAKTDPIRRLFIGIAPSFLGLFVLLSVYWFLSPTFLPITWKTILFFYSIFEIGNTMFSSRKDIEGAIIAIVFIVLFLLLLFFLQVPIVSFFSAFLNIPQIQVFFQQLSFFSLVAIVIDGTITFSLMGLIRILEK